MYVSKGKGPTSARTLFSKKDMRISLSRREQDKGSLNDEAFSIDKEKEEEDMGRSSSAVTTGGGLLLFGDGDEAIASTRVSLVYLQEVPRDITYEY